jgi:hypothetical protein
MKQQFNNVSTIKKVALALMLAALTYGGCSRLFGGQETPYTHHTTFPKLEAQVDTTSTIVDTSKQEVSIDSDLSQLIDAMIWVESKDNDSAYNSRENAAGCLQIRPICVAEVNRVLKLQGDTTTTYDLQDRWSREKSIEMFMVIYNYHHKPYKHSFEHVARDWNGGPNGDSMSATLGYWSNVQQAMNI